MKILSAKVWLIGSLIGASALLGLESIRAQDPKAQKQAAEAQIDGQRAQLDAQMAQLDAQKAQIREKGQKVSEIRQKTQKLSEELAAKTVAGVRMRTSVADAIRTAAAAVHDAKDDEAKATAQKTLDDQLSKFFDDDMVRREQELKQIEERLAKLRELLDRRRARKQDIVELQTKVALNEVEGLGFYDNDASRGGFGNVFGGNFRYNTSTPPLVFGPPEPLRIDGQEVLQGPVPAPAPKPQPAAPATKPAQKPRASSSSLIESSSSSSSSNDNSAASTAIPDLER